MICDFFFYRKEILINFNFLKKLFLNQKIYFLIPSFMYLLITQYIDLGSCLDSVYEYSIGWYMTLHRLSVYLTTNYFAKLSVGLLSVYCSTSTARFDIETQVGYFSIQRFVSERDMHSPHGEEYTSYDSQCPEHARRN